MLKYLFFFITFLQIAASAQQNALNDYLADYLKKKDLPSVSAGVMRDGNIVFSFSKGFADVENKVRVNDSSKYRIASVSKTISAVAFLRLCELGKAHLDTSITRYITGLPRQYLPITPRMILAHISGIRAYKEDGEFDSKQYFPTTQSVVDYLLKDSLAAKPGSKYIYSSLAYNFIALIIEKQTGKPFEDFLKNEIFKPAGMRNSGLDWQAKIIYNRTRGYHKNNKRQLENAALADPTIKFAGGGIYSTVPDLLNFGNALLSGKLLNEQSRREMFKENKLSNGETISYGLGIGIGKDDKGRRFFEHFGAGTGFSSLLTLFPDQKMVGVHLINCRDRDLNAPARELVSALLGDQLIAMKSSLSSSVLPLLLEKDADSDYVAFAKNLLTTDSVTQTKNDWKQLQEDAAANGISSRLIAFSKICIDVQPENPAILTRAAELFFRDNNNGTALQLSRKALQVKPGFKDAEELLGKINGSK